MCIIEILVCLYMYYELVVLLTSYQICYLWTCGLFTGIPSSQPHSAPSGQFFQVVGMINSHMPLIENLFREVIAPCIK